ncbi:hypothetical protein FTUN_6911 [Frigoriglobus tundricola]|uniref:Uncharacterized protein n=1 Tax=Frigoriglobus tundricola TaxID=2774151 RepID=A0A6M5YZK7_9BACT|nr:hypothetical protein FTUN_6911 [Frigoriglobus tundricola]
MVRSAILGEPGRPHLRQVVRALKSACGGTVKSEALRASGVFTP